MLIDLIYIIDIIINFFRAYQDFDEHLIRKARKIFLHYLKTWFIADFIQAIPYYSLIQFYKNMKHIDNNNFIVGFGINPLIYQVLMIKVIKVYKMLYYNSTISY